MTPIIVRENQGIHLSKKINLLITFIVLLILHFYVIFQYSQICGSKGLQLPALLNALQQMLALVSLLHIVEFFSFVKIIKKKKKNGPN